VAQLFGEGAVEGKAGN